MKTKVDIQAVKDTIDMYGLDVKSRNRELVYRRYATYAFMRKYTTWSYERIGRLFTGKDHASVLHGVRMHDMFIMDNDQLYKEIIALIVKDLDLCFLEVLPDPEKKKVSYYEQRIMQANNYEKFKQLRIETMIKINRRNNPELNSNLATQKIHTLL